MRFFRSKMNQKFEVTSFNDLITGANAVFYSLLKFVTFGIKSIAEANDLLFRLYLGEQKAALV